MAITKQLRELYHGDPLLMEVIAGLQEVRSTMIYNLNWAPFSDKLTPNFQNHILQRQSPQTEIKRHVPVVGEWERGAYQMVSLFIPSMIFAHYSILIHTPCTDEPSSGDPLLQESLRHQQQGQDQSEALELARCLRRDKYTSLFSPYRDLVFDPILEEYVIPDEQKLLAMLNKAEPKKCGVEMQEGLLKRGKNESLFSPHSEAMYDPILHEYTLPSESMAQLKALQDDIIMKHKLFSEMKMRRSRNLENNGVHCDPLVHVYRITAVLVSQSKCAIPSEVKSSPTALSTGEFSVYRKPHCGDDLMKASDDYHKKMYW